MKRNLAWVYPALLIIIAVLVPTGCGGEHEVPETIDIAPDNPLVRLDGNLIKTLGQLTGPYLLVDVLSPSRIEVTDFETQNPRVFELIGLEDDANLLSTLEADQPTTEAEELNEEAREEQAKQAELRRQAIRNLKMTALGEMLDEANIWVMPMTESTEGRPAKVYAFKTRERQSITRTPSGAGILVNAALLREGKATMPVDQTRHPLYLMMLDNMLSAYLEAQDQPATPENPTNLWSDFNLTLPETEVVEKQLTRIKKVLGISE